MDDLISRQAAIDELVKMLSDCFYADEEVLDAVKTTLKELPPAQPEQHIDADGTLWITVSDIEQVKRVIVDEEKSKFCKQFYQDAEPREDAVSRKAVQYLLAHFVDEDKYVDACDGLKHLPPVTPKQSTEALKAEIKRMKRSFTICINSDYYTGYMSALSAVEGYIAQWEGANDAKT